MYIRVGSGSRNVVTFESGGDNAHKHLADWASNLGVKLCVLGIAAASRPMVEELSKRRNVFTGHLGSGASIRDIKGVVRVLQGHTRRDQNTDAVLVCPNTLPENMRCGAVLHGPVPGRCPSRSILN